MHSEREQRAMSASSPPPSNTNQRQSLKRPLIKIKPKKRASKKEINRSNIKRNKASSSTCSTSSSLSSSFTGNSGLPSILTKQYSTNNIDRRGDGNNVHRRNDADDDDDYNDDPSFAAMLENYIQEDVHEIILTMQSLISRHSAAICPFAMENHNDYIPFVLKSMVQHALHSTSTCSDSSKNVNNTSKLSTLSQLSKKQNVQTKNNNHLSSAYIATEINVDLNQLDSENKIRMIQLHGMTTVNTTGKTVDNGGDDNRSKNNTETIDNDENIALLFMEDYIKGIHDACAADATVPSNPSNNENLFETKHEHCHRNKFITQLFIDCVHHHGCNGLYVTRDKLCSSFESA